jgi:LPS sulfotransferase NodH
MPVTTIKVDVDVRDRLAAVAQARGKTMGALLAEVAKRLADEHHAEEILAAYTRLKDQDPAGWQAYLEELAAWDAGTTAMDTAAAEEWPEYNQPATPPPGR